MSKATKKPAKKNAQAFFTIRKVRQSLYQLVQVQGDNVTIIKEDLPAIIMGLFMREVYNAPFMGDK